MKKLIKWVKNWLLPSRDKLISSPEISPISRNTYLHEAGHYIMAYMFQENFTLKFITVDKGKMNATWNGGFKFAVAPTSKNSPDFADQLSLITISGICVNTIGHHGADLVAENLYKFPNDVSLLRSQGADVDYDIFKQEMSKVSFYFGLNPIRTEWNAFIFAFKFFLHKEVWLAVEGIADLMISSNEQTFTHVKLDEYLKKREYYFALDNIKKKILMERYPLNRHRLLLNIPNE